MYEKVKSEDCLTAQILRHRVMDLGVWLQRFRPNQESGPGSRIEERIVRPNGESDTVKLHANAKRGMATNAKRVNRIARPASTQAVLHLLG